VKRPIDRSDTTLTHSFTQVFKKPPLYFKKYKNYISQESMKLNTEPQNEHLAGTIDKEAHITKFNHLSAVDVLKQLKTQSRSNAFTTDVQEFK
jgi:hypothetical protein